jgi:hypothetical protein
MLYFTQLLHIQDFLGDIKALGFRTNIPLLLSKGQAGNEVAFTM